MRICLKVLQPSTGDINKAMISNIFRAIQIIRTLNKKGVLFLIKSKLPFILSPFIIKDKNTNKGDILREAFYALGPCFVKLGQMLSTREDLVGKEICYSLESLQDSMPRIEVSYAKETIKRNFDQDLEELFSHFDHKSVASASIAEVFKAKTIDGRNVAVKIIKPNVKTQIDRDMSLLRSCANLFTFFSSEARRLRLDKVVERFQEFINSELDLCIEAATISKIKEIHKDDENIYTPKVFWEYTSSEILTMEWIDGFKVNKVDLLEAQNIDRHKIASSLILMFFKQSLEYGYFHADLHPGNILIQDNGQITLLDYGIIGHLTAKDRHYIAEILYGFIKRDYEYVAKIHFDAGYVPKTQSLFQFTQACRAIGEPIIDLPANKISIAKLLTRLLETTKKFQMETQPQLLLLQKTMVMVEGLAKKIAPDINLWNITKPFLEEWAKQNLSFDSKVAYALKEIRSDYANLSEFIKLGLSTQKMHNQKKISYLLISNIISLSLLIYILLGK